MTLMSRRKFFRLFATGALGIPLMSLGGLVYVQEIEPNWLDVNPVTLRLKRLGAGMAGYRIVQISDLHVDIGGVKDRLPRLQALINAQAPDLIVITGDFVTNDLKNCRAALHTFLSGLQARDGRAAVLGNHDYWLDAAGVRQVLHDADVWDMTNRVWTLERGGAVLHLCGLDDYWAGKPDLDAVLAALPPTGAALLLLHEPDIADLIAPTGRFDVQLSGHSHGGQVRLPILNVPIETPRYAERYPVGQYQVGSMIQYTNRGIGTIYPAVRFNCRPEVTVFTLEQQV